MLAEAELRLVVEHHGGPQRLARLSATIRQTKMLFWLQAGMAVSAVVTWTAGLYLAPFLLSLLFTLFYMLPLKEASRLEMALKSAADEIASELGKVLRDEDW